MDGYVDSHFHIWDLQKFSYLWPSKDQGALFNNYSLDDYIVSQQGTPVSYGVFIQVLNSTPAEAEWMLGLAEKHTCIKGIVAGLDLTKPEVIMSHRAFVKSEHKLTAQLDTLCKNPRIVGVRHILDFEDEKWIMRDDVHKGLDTLEQKGLTFDLLLRPHLLKYVPSIAAKFPNLRMVIDHIAKPLIKTHMFDGWKDEMAEIAKHANIYCKVSGLVNEADPDNWTLEDFKPYVKHIFDIFGEDRCMYGSDWPVSLNSHADFKDTFKIAQDLVSYNGMSPEARAKFFRWNAIRFYNLKL